MTNDVGWFKAFVANRVQKIEDSSTSGQWCLKKSCR